MILLPVTNIGKVENSSVVIVLAREDGVVDVCRMSIGNWMGFMSTLARRLHPDYYVSTHSWCPIVQSLKKEVSDTLIFEDKEE